MLSLSYSKTILLLQFSTKIIRFIYWRHYFIYSWHKHELFKNIQFQHFHANSLNMSCEMLITKISNLLFSVGFTSSSGYKFFRICAVVFSLFFRLNYYSDRVFAITTILVAICSCAPRDTKWFMLNWPKNKRKKKQSCSTSHYLLSMFELLYFSMQWCIWKSSNRRKSDVANWLSDGFFENSWCFILTLD